MAKAKAKENKEIIECTNSVDISGKIDKIMVQTDKVVIMSIDSTKQTPNGKYAHTWATVCEFNPEIEYEVGDFVKVFGYLNTDSYEKNGKKFYQLRVIADTVEVIDIP